MKIDDFLQRLKGVESDGKGGWMACCPSHDDDNPSMHVNVGDDGRILVKCFAGCTTEDICKGAGIELKDLMAENPGTTSGKRRSRERAPAPVDPESLVQPSFKLPKKKDFGKFVCEYIYRREDGAAVFKVVRKIRENGKKTFCQMSPDPSSPNGWRYGVEKHGVAYIPYNIPHIRKAAEKGMPVVIVEGEKDADTIVRRLRMVATCNPKGAGKWQPGYGRFFEGVPRILIIADKDPATKKILGEDRPFLVGQKHAVDVERKLVADGYRGEIRKICMPDVDIEDGVTKHVKDFTDWCEAMDAAGKTVDRAAFKAAVDAFGAWPQEWTFEDDDLADIARVEKDARHTASSPSDAELPGEGDEVGEYEEDGKTYGMGDTGRYGRVSPAPPVKGARSIQVDFEIRAGQTARFDIGTDVFRFEGWMKDDARGTKHYGDYYRAAAYDPIRCAPNQLPGLAIGSIMTFTQHTFKPNAAQMCDLFACLALAWLRARGKFFADVNQPNYETSMFFDDARGILYRLHDDEFKTFVATALAINREAKTFKFVTSLIDDFALDPDHTTRVVPSKQWERRGGRVYFSCGDSEMYRVGPGTIDRVLNGTDGVVFLRGRTLAPWTLKDGPGKDPFVDALLFKSAAWSDGNGRMNIRLWMLNLFACHKNKPILLVTGPARSGKTRLAIGLKEIIGIRDEGELDTSVTNMDASDKGREAFWVLINEGRLEIFDNFDEKVKWAFNDLQTAATNGSDKRRELYKTKNIVILRANSSIVVTSNNPVFAADGGGLPDRIISVYLDMSRKKSLGNELAEDIAANRDQYLTWTVRTIAAALADKAPVDQSINKRHPDYGEFSIRCARALGLEKEAVAAMAAAEIDKALLPIRNDVVAKEIYTVLVSQERVGCLSFTAGEMSEMIIARIGEDEKDDKTRQIYGSRRVGKALSKFSTEFATLFKVAPPKTVEGRTRYQFTGLTPAGESVVKPKAVDLVDLKSTFGKSHLEQAHAGEFSENGISNAPNPPYARAHAQEHDILTQKEANMEDLPIGEEDDDEFFF